MFCEEDTQCNNWVSLLLTFKTTTMQKKQFGVIAYLNDNYLIVRLRYTHRDVAIKVIEFLHNKEIQTSVTEVSKNKVVISTEFVFTTTATNLQYIKSFSREGKIKRLQNEVNQLRLTL